MPQHRFSVFLSHNSQDKAVVEDLARRLVEAGLQPWLDKWVLIPGEAWQTEIEKGLQDCASCAVILGPSGLSPWQTEEMRAAIEIRVQSPDYRVIPVVVPGGAPEEGEPRPAFLRATTWVQFKRTLDEAEPFHRLTCGIRGVPPEREIESGPIEGVCPYQGLKVFDGERTRYFYGREALTGALLDRLRAGSGAGREIRFLGIVGASGSGESSIALAGVIPAVREGQLPAGEDWPILLLRPGTDPLESLAVALAADPVIKAQVSDPLALKQQLLDEPARLQLLVRTALHGKPPELRVLVLVDQFEETFTLQAGGGETPGAAARAFVENLLYAASIPMGQTVLMLTMRADYFGSCAAYPGLAEAIANDQALVGPMTEDELRRAIERPAHAAGCELEPGLTELLIADVRHQAGGLPLLQYTLTRLWEGREGRRLTLAEYDRVGRIAGALEQRVEELYRSFSSAEQAVSRRMFLRLTQRAEGDRYAKRRVLRADLDGLGEAGVVAGALQRLTDEYLLTTYGEAGTGSSVEVGHEALIGGWSRLRNWLQASADLLDLLNHLGQDAHEWQDHDRDSAFLYRDTRLAEAEELTEGRRDELSELEGAFLDANIALRERRTRQRARRRRLLWMGVQGVALMAIAAAGAMTWLYVRAVDAEEAAVAELVNFHWIEAVTARDAGDDPLAAAHHLMHVAELARNPVERANAYLAGRLLTRNLELVEVL